MKMRLFIAIPFEPPVLDAFTAAQVSLKASGVRGNYTVRQNLHLTLAFLGEVRDPRSVMEVLERAPLPRVTLTFSKTELFRDILVCRFGFPAVFLDYVENLRRLLDESGIEYDRKPFRAHVTLIRRASCLKETSDASLLEQYFGDLDIPVSRVCLMRTDFINGRPKYTVLHTIHNV